MSDPQLNRRVDRLAPDDLAALEAAKAAVQSERGKQLTRARAEKVERSFEHVLDCGGGRHTTLRLRENIRKRYLIQAACANLSLLMRHTVGVGTPKQALAGAYAGSVAVFAFLFGLIMGFGPSRLPHLRPFEHGSQLRASEQGFNLFRRPSVGTAHGRA